MVNLKETKGSASKVPEAFVTLIQKRGFVVSETSPNRVEMIAPNTSLKGLACESNISMGTSETLDDTRGFDSAYDTLSVFVSPESFNFTYSTVYGDSDGTGGDGGSRYSACGINGPLSFLHDFQFDETKKTLTLTVTPEGGKKFKVWGGTSSHQGNKLAAEMYRDIGREGGYSCQVSGVTAKLEVLPEGNNGISEVINVFAAEQAKRAKRNSVPPFLGRIFRRG